MKYFQILLILGINFSTILLSQSIEIPHKMMSMQDTTINIPIFIYGVSELESIQIEIEYDESIILAEEIIENPVGILDGGYTFNPNLTEPGIIQLGIGSNSAILFSGNGMVAQIIFNKPISNTPEFSAVTFLDAQINSNGEISAVDGSIEIVLDELIITGQDESEIGADHLITLGMCEGCADGWSFGEDEYDYPDPFSGEFTNIHFFHLDWNGTKDAHHPVNENGVTNFCCAQIEFKSDHRSQHSFRELTKWGIRGSTGGGLSSDLDINLSWDSEKLNTNSDNFKMYLNVGNTKYNMQEMDSISVLQSDLNLVNNEPNIWVKMGGCADTGETSIYYRDFDNDGFGSCTLDTLDEFENCISCEEDPDCVYFCEGLQPTGWVSNHTDLNYNLFCLSNNIDDCDVCDGFNGDKDCSGECFGTATEDSCGVCNGNNDCVDCNGIAYGDSVVDCNGDCDGDAYLDNCLFCIESESEECELDCNGTWGGLSEFDECGICGGNENNGNDICDITCPNNEVFDCNGDCGGGALKDDCGVCVGGQTGNTACSPDCNEDLGGIAFFDNCGECVGGLTEETACSPDCNGEWGGDLIEDMCGTCNDDPSDDCVQDCNGEWGGILVNDNCGTCDNDASNDCIQDCNNDWGGNAYLDNCLFCVESESEECELDCLGDWGGYAFMDECDICDSDNTNNNQCYDCNFEPNEGATLDNCGNCILEEENTTCEMDCTGEWGGDTVLDECGVCNNYDTQPAFPYGTCDCAGTPNGEAWLNACVKCVPLSDTSCPVDCNEEIDGLAYLDECGNCILEGENTTCEMDCNGEWGGSAEIDEHCPICFGGTTGLEPCIEDCNGVCCGNFEEDLCGICDADSGNNNQCVDCNGMVDGLAYRDNCGNCVEDLSDSSYECEPDCDHIYGGNHPPTFTCQNGDIACNYDACFLAINEFQLPQRFDIHRIYPNPFNPQATIDFEVSEPTMVQLNIYNLRGQKVDVLKNEFTLPGYYSVIWNGTNYPSGIYFVILNSSNSIVKQKMMLIK